MTAYEYYMRDINKLTVNDKSTNETLMKKYLEGDEEAREKLINGNLRLVLHVVGQFKNENIDYMDLVQQGNMGLIHAIDTYDLNRASLSTYIVLCVKAYITRYISDQSRTIRRPVWQQETTKKINEIIAMYKEDFHHAPSVEEIAAELELPVSKVEQILKDNASTLTSLDAVLDDDDSTLYDCIADEAVETNETGLKKAVKVALDSLTDSDREFLERYYGLNGRKPESLKSIGKSRNKTKQNASLDKMMILSKLRYPDILKEIRKQL